ncbi:hypothetical protein BKA70DRAFT_1222793 [Coprinopsis sp. MPI-PUGE-AT-0042]|nr:hypothetical protein BKA70DRAFT_1222793 [Coprinopsis sp. MPI-PUGE-AT-0042]
MFKFGIPVLLLVSKTERADRYEGMLHPSLTCSRKFSVAWELGTHDKFYLSVSQNEYKPVSLILEQVLNSTEEVVARCDYFEPPARELLVDAHNIYHDHDQRTHLKGRRVCHRRRLDVTGRAGTLLMLFARASSYLCLAYITGCLLSFAAFCLKLSAATHALTTPTLDLYQFQQPELWTCRNDYCIENTLLTFWSVELDIIITVLFDVMLLLADLLLVHRCFILLCCYWIVWGLAIAPPIASFALKAGIVLIMHSTITQSTKAPYIFLCCKIAISWLTSMTVTASLLLRIRRSELEADACASQRSEQTELRRPFTYATLVLLESVSPPAALRLDTLDVMDGHCPRDILSGPCAWSPRYLEVPPSCLLGIPASYQRPRRTPKYPKPQVVCTTVVLVVPQTIRNRTFFERPSSPSYRRRLRKSCWCTSRPLLPLPFLL